MNPRELTRTEIWTWLTEFISYDDNHYTIIIIIIIVAVYCSIKNNKILVSLS